MYMVCPCIEFKMDKKEQCESKTVNRRQSFDNGKINIKNCNKAGLSAHDVSFKLRTKNVYSIRDVKRAVVEQNGQLIIIQPGEENPKFPIITDGHLQTDILSLIGKDEKWLIEELKKQGLNKYRDVFLGEYVDGNLILEPYHSK